VGEDPRSLGHVWCEPKCSGAARPYGSDIGEVDAPVFGAEFAAQRSPIVETGVEDKLTWKPSGIGSKYRNVTGGEFGDDHVHGSVSLLGKDQNRHCSSQPQVSSSCPSSPSL